MKKPTGWREDEGDNRKMLENGIIYTVEVIKYYIIMKYLLGFKVRRNVILSIFGAIVIGAFSIYVTLTTDNPMGIFLIYIFIEMFLLIKEKISIVILSTCWLMIIVGMLDGMFLVIMEFLAYNMNFSYSVLDCMAAIVNMLFLMMLVWVVKKRTNGESFKIAKVYYIYLSLLTLAESVLITVMENVLREEYNTKMLLLILGCTIIMLLNIVIVLCLAVSNDGYRQRDELNRKYLKIQEENYIYLKEKNEDVRKFRHDMKSHMFIMRELMKKNDWSQLGQYINRVDNDIHLSDKHISVSNGIVDAILNKYWHEANKLGVQICIEGQLFEDCFIEPYDLCVIFDNILKNAIEAATKSVEKNIYLRVCRKESVQIYIENSFSGNVEKHDEEYITTKNEKENHGYGIKNMKHSVEKYNGIVSMDVMDSLFKLNIYIPLV